MAELAGVYIADASGNRLQDGSSNYIVDQNIVVAVSPGGILYSANQNVADDLWRWVRDKLEGDDAGFIQWLFDMTETADIVAKLGRLLDNWQDMTAPASGDSVTYRGKTDSYTGYTFNKLLTNIGWVRAKAEGQGDPDLNDVLDAIAAISPGGLTQEEHDVLMPLVNPDLTTIPGDVWGYTFPMSYLNGTYWGPMAQTVVQGLGDWMQKQIGFEGIPIPGRPYFRFVAFQFESGLAWVGDWQTTAHLAALPALDLSLVEEGDTVGSYLTREYPAYAWSTDAPYLIGSGQDYWLPGATTTSAYHCTLTDAIIKACWPTVSPTVAPDWSVDLNVTVESPPLAPVWPGADKVTLGTPVALADQLVINASMNGVIVAVTTPPQKLGRYMVGGETLDYGVGRITFGTDSGDLEPWQYLGFRSAIFTPKTMVEAASVHLQVIGGAEGTVTPWAVS